MKIVEHNFFRTKTLDNGGLSGTSISLVIKLILLALFISHSSRILSEHFLVPFWSPTPVWGSKPLLGYFALTGSLVQPMQQGANLTPTQLDTIQRIALQEVESLRQIELESRAIIEGPLLTQEEKRELIAQMNFNPRVNQVVRRTSLRLESALGTSTYNRLVRWIIQRWTVERYLHGGRHKPFAIVGAVDMNVETQDIASLQDFASLPNIASLPKSPVQQRTFKIFATHYDSKGAYYVALPDQCLKLTNGGLKTCVDKGYQVGKEYSAYVSYKKQGAAARVGESGPWNVDDNYWATLSDPTPRRMFADLALGMPEAQAAYFNGYNGGVDQYGRKVTAPFGIDLSRKVGDDIGLKWGVNDWVSISYLWTAEWGSSRSDETADQSSAGAAATPMQTLASVGSVKLSTPDNAGKVSHKVQAGETLWSIAVAYKVSLASLYTINNLNAQSVIMPGQTLTIRLPGTGITETVKENPTAAPTHRPTSTPKITSTPTGPGNPETSPLPVETLTVNETAEERGINWTRLFIKYDPLLGIIILFMVSGIVLIVIGRFIGNKPEQ